MNDESHPTQPLPSTPADPSSIDAPVVDLGDERRRRRRFRVIVATLITGSLVTGGASYALVSGRGAAQSIAGVTPITSAPSYTPPGSSGSPGGGIPTLPDPGSGRSDDDSFGGSLTDSTDTTSATQRQQVGVVDIYTELADGSQAAGTGMVLTSTGQVLTNNHVIEGSTRIEAVVVSNGQTYAARVVGTDVGHDIAVLQLDGAHGLDTVTTDTSADVAVGDTVTGVGNAGGDGGDPSAASGKVVALDRSITVHSASSSQTEHLGGLIKVDADIISGDSGGPLYDADTEVIGIDTAASTGRANVTGFAIPIGTALAIVDDIEAGRTTGGIQLGYPAFLGVGLAPSTASSGGVLITGVRSGSAAARVRMSAGDTITRFDGVAVRSAEQLIRLVGGHKPGDTASVGWIDNAGTSHTATVTLGDGPAA